MDASLDNVQDPDLVIVRGINEDHKGYNFGELCIEFGGDAAVANPARDAYYVALYQGAPRSEITHIGIVDHIYKEEKYTEYNLKAIVILSKPVPTHDGHPIRKHEYWSLQDLGLKRSDMEELREKLYLV